MSCMQRADHTVWSNMPQDMLERAMRRVGLTADAANAVRDVLRTVAQCHARNVLIRDVKPDNFLYLTSDEEAPLKAIDFGLAQYCKPDENLRDKAGMPQHR